MLQCLFSTPLSFYVICAIIVIKYMMKNNEICIVEAEQIGYNNCNHMTTGSTVENLDHAFFFWKLHRFT